MNRPCPWGVTVSTNENWYEMTPLEKSQYIPKGTRTLVEFPIDEWDITYKPGLRLQAQEFYNHLKGFPSTLPTLSDSLNTMRIINMIYDL